MPASTLSSISESFEADDAAVQAILTDPIGGATTYGPLLPLIGIKTALLTGQVKAEDLRGAGQLIDSRAKLQSLTMTITHAELELKAYAAMVGGTQVGPTGVAPAGIQKWGYNKSDTRKFPVFAFQAQSLVGPDEGADSHLVCYKCRLEGWPQIGFADETFHIFGATFRCLPQRGTQQPGEIVDLFFNETALAIAALV